MCLVSHDFDLHFQLQCRHWSRLSLLFGRDILDASASLSFIAAGVGNDEDIEGLWNIQ